MIDAKKILAAPPVEAPFSYGARDTMLHALGIGLGMDPLDQDQLRYVYEDGAGLRVFPTQSTVLGWVDLFRDRRFNDPSWGLDANRMVVGQLAFRAIEPLPVAGEGTARTYFAQAVDRGAGKAALLRVCKEIRSPQDTLLATMDTWHYIRGAGGFSGPRDGGPERFEMPDRPPDAVCDLPTPANMALLFRLSLGDHNALHADPEHARRVGFEQPILHGIANLSIAVHAALRALLDYNDERIAGAQARMSGPVLPGDTLRSELWREEATIYFRCSALERGGLVIDGGRIDLAG